MKISRLDLDGVGSPLALVTRIYREEPDMPVCVPVEELCKKLDIISIETLHSDGFEAALITDRVKSNGAILIAAGQSRQRWRFSVCHELGHFLIPTHLPSQDGSFLCSKDDLKRLETKEQNRRVRMEVEANRFAAALLMPPHRMREQLRQHRPDLNEVLRLAILFGVSKEAMARCYAEQHREPVAIIISKDNRLARIYRNKDFPYLQVWTGNNMPAEALGRHGNPGSISALTDTDPENWFEAHVARNIAGLSEQILLLNGGWSFTLLHAEVEDNDDHGRSGDGEYQVKF